MGGQKVRHVTAKNRTSGVVFQGVQDIDTGLVYPFVSAEDCASVVEDVHAGREDIESYGPIYSPESYDIEEVA